MEYLRSGWLNHLRYRGDNAFISGIRIGVTRFLNQIYNKWEWKLDEVAGLMSCNPMICNMPRHDIFSRSNSICGLSLSAMQSAGENGKGAKPSGNREKKFRKSGFYAEILEHVEEAIVVIGPDGIIRYVSPSIEELAGYLPSELIDSDIFQFIHPEDKGLISECSTGQSKRIKRTEQVTIRLKYKSGGWVEVGVAGKALPEDRELSGVILQLYDASECQRLQYNLRKVVRENRAVAKRCRQNREHDRKLLARELHDDLGQSVSLLNLDLQLLELRLNKQVSDEQRKALEQDFVKIKKNITDISKSVQHLVQQLRPPVLDKYGLDDAITWEVNRMNSENMKAIYHSELDDDLPEPVKTHAFRITQEALNNVYRHSDATRVEVTTRLDDTGFALMIEDNGVGFKLNDTNTFTSYGLLNMKERARELGGWLEIVTQPGSGTSITLEVSEPKISAIE